MEIQKSWLESFWLRRAVYFIRWIPCVDTMTITKYVHCLAIWYPEKILPSLLEILYTDRMIHFNVV